MVILLMMTKKWGDFMYDKPFIFSLIVVSVLLISLFVQNLRLSSEREIDYRQISVTEEVLRNETIEQY